MSVKLETRLILSDRHRKWQRSSKLGKARAKKIMRGRIGNYQDLEGFEPGDITAVLCIDAPDCTDITIVGENKAAHLNMEDLNQVNSDHTLGGNIQVSFRGAKLQEKRQHRNVVCRQHASDLQKTRRRDLQNEAFNEGTLLQGQ